jgi:protein-S-isoprenylcysteine O-methyltransferase Ste14
MAARTLDFRIVLLIVISTAIVFIVPPLAWGSVSGLLAHPARIGALVVMIASVVAFPFSGMNFSSLRWDDPKSRAVLPLGILATLPLLSLPVYADRHDILVCDGDWARYTGLALYTVGIVLRIGPMFQLKNRFRAPWTAQEEHYLVTTGFYRYVRHPSYLGVFLIGMGWFLIFRCWIGFVLCLLLIPPAVPVIRREEAKLYDEFGEPYAAYRRRTWLFPLIK